MTPEKWMIAALFGVQSLLMLVDEMVFHKRRLAEKRAHRSNPFDLPLVIGCFGIALFAPPSMTALGIFAVMALASCLMMNRDPKIPHTATVEKTVHLLALLLHPAALFGAAYAWLHPQEGLRFYVFLQMAAVTAIRTYRFMAWNLMPPGGRPR